MWTAGGRPARGLWSRRHLRALCVAATSGVLVAVAAAPVAAAVITTANPVALAEAMTAPGTELSGAALVATTAEGTPLGIGDSPLVGFPTDGPTYTVLTTGDANLADQPFARASVENGGGSVRGARDRDVSILRVDFAVPPGLNCVSFDLRFLTNEIPDPESVVDDAFIAELDESTWTTASPNVIDAPNNFAVDQFGNPINVASAAQSLTPGFDPTTGYRFGTPLLRQATHITPGPHSLFLSIFDMSDQREDSAALVDNLAMSFAATPDECAAAVLQSDLSLSPPHAIDQIGGTHAVTAALRGASSGTPTGSAPVIFRVDGVNPASPTTVFTDAAGHATFSYTGVNPGEDVVTACDDANRNGVCDPDEAFASVIKLWEATPPPLLALTPPSATNNVGATHSVTAHLTDAGGTAIPNGRIRFEVREANEVTGTATTNSGGDAVFSYHGDGVGTDTITACFDANHSDTCGFDEVTATATKTWLAPEPVLTVAPTAAANPVGTQHTVTATLTSGGTPVESATIVFTVTGANPNTGLGRSAADGGARFGYVGTNPGSDTITACFDANFNDVCDPGEATVTATKTWEATALSLVPATGTNTVGASHTVTATLVVSPSGPPVAAGLIVFSVTGANTAGGETTTSASGTATFTYTGRTAGTDTITACQDTNENRRCDLGEATATATMTWVGLAVTGMRLIPVLAAGGGFVLLGAVALLVPLLARRRR